MRLTSAFAIVFFVVAVVAIAVHGVSIQERELQGRFNGWMRQHARSYDSDEFLERYNIWRDNMAFVEEFNREGGKSFTVAMNQYGDLAPEEFARLHKGHIQLEDESELRKRLDETAAVEESGAEEDAAALVGATVPGNWNWTAEGAVTGVENQGSCLSCWAFAAAGALESARKIANSSLVVLSKQQLVDCSGSAGNLGCSGGNVGLAYNWMRSNDAKLMSEASYPYTGRQATCRYAAAQGVAGIRSYASVTAGSESSLLTHAAVGPVAVAIDSSKRSYIYYSGGYYYEPTCSTSYLDHAVLVVGWGTDATHGDYWLVKNQWGSSWGENGYVKMARNKSNNCGIASLAVRPCLGAACTTTPNTSLRK